MRKVPLLFYVRSAYVDGKVQLAVRQVRQSFIEELASYEFALIRGRGTEKRRRKGLSTQAN